MQVVPFTCRGRQCLAMSTLWATSYIDLHPTQDVPVFNSNATEDGMRLQRMKNLKEHGVDVINPITTMLHKELCFEFLVYYTSVTLEPSTWLFWILSSNINKVNL